MTSPEAREKRPKALQRGGSSQLEWRAKWKGRGSFSFSRGGRQRPLSLFPPGPRAGSYPFLLISVSPRDLHESRSLQQAPSTPRHQRSHVSVRRRLLPAGTTTPDSQVPERWCAQAEREREGFTADSSRGSADSEVRASSLHGSSQDAGKEQPFAQNKMEAPPGCLEHRESLRKGSSPSWNHGGRGAASK